jgi:hypothetical protein
MYFNYTTIGTKVSKKLFIRRLLDLIFCEL